MGEIRIIVAGSRNFTDTEYVHAKLDEFISSLQEGGNDIDKIVFVSGCCRGVDAAGEAYANLNGYELMRFPANWGKYGRGAGPIRNEEMVSYVSTPGVKGYLVAFWDGKSSGTRSVIGLARSHDVEVKIIRVST